MPPKNKKQNDFAMPEEKLVAVVLTDSYQPNFMPLTIEKPRCLLPLANTPLIEYTLEFLATAKVSKVYVYCCALAEMVEDYVNQSKWKKNDGPFEIETVKVPETMSVGDAMRDLDAKGLIESDFLLISGDVVCNIDFQKIWKKHKETRDSDRNAIMSMVLREGSALHRTRPRAHPGIFVLDEATGKCLRYEEATTTHRGRRINGHVAIDADLLNEYDNLLFRNDLIDCRIDICSPDVPALFQENFDYDELRSDFVRGILTSDLLGKTIYAQILSDNSYAARVESPQTYSAVGKDIVSRYTYPICPDSNMLDDQKYSYQRGHIYKEDGVVLSQSAHIGPRTVVGSETFIGAKSSVKDSVIGRRCKIGENVVLDGAYIWDDVVIEDNVVVNKAIIANGAVIKRGAVVESGAIISYGVVIGADRTVPHNVKLTKQLRVRVADSDDESEDGDDDGRSRVSVTSSRTSMSQQTSALSIVGDDGEGYLYHDSDYESDSDDDDDDSAIVSNSADKSIDGLIYSMENFELSDTSVDSMRSSAGRHRHHRTYSTASTTSATSGISDDNDAEDFSKEVVASIERSIMDNHTQEIALLELNTLRMTMNAPHEKLRSATVQALIAHIARMVTTETLDAKQATEQLFNKWTMVLNRITHGPEDEADLLQDIQEECTRRPQGNKILFYAASVLYDNDVVKEDNIYSWWNSKASVGSEQLKSVRELTGRWVEWLQNAEEESDSE